MLIRKACKDGVPRMPKLGGTHQTTQKDNNNNNASTNQVCLSNKWYTGELLCWLKLFYMPSVSKTGKMLVKHNLNFKHGRKIKGKFLDLLKGRLKIKI